MKKYVMSFRGDNVSPTYIFQYLKFQRRLSLLNLSKETKFKMNLDFARSISKKVEIEKENDTTFIVCHI